MAKVLITTVPFGDKNRLPLDLLERSGIEYLINPLNKKLTEDELAGAKEMVVGKDALHGEGSNDMAIQLVMEEFATKAENVYRYESNINNVSLNDVRELAKDAEWAEFWVGP